MLERTYTIAGVRPLLMHCDQMSDPLNKWARALREISKKRTKTDDDHLEMSRREWFGGLYWAADLGVHVPERCLERMMRDAASKTRRGKDVVSGMIVQDPAPLEFKGPKDPEALWAHGGYVLRASVGVNSSRVVRSRPMFPDWRLSFTVEYDESILDADALDGFVNVAGRQIGLGDWRPKYGRFTVEGVA